MKQSVIPTEHDEQSALFSWAVLSRHPELDLMFAIPNAAKRSFKLAAMMKAEGLKSGVPDIFLPVARNGRHGLFIEMKRVKGSVTSKAQSVWIESLNNAGYKAVICKGWIEAKDAIEDYLS